MSKVLLVTNSDIKRHTIINGSVDVDNFIHYINIAQDIYIQNYLGTDLFNKLKDLISSSTINEVANSDYKLLLQEYIAPMVIHWTAVEYIPFAAFVLTNKGIYQNEAENAQIASSEDIEKLVSKERDIAQHYSDRFVEYICEHHIKYPEYTSNTGSDVDPNDVSYYGGLHLNY